MAESNKYSVGDKVRFQFGLRKVVGIVKEDRGPIGLKGRRLYSIVHTPSIGSDIWIELPAIDLELVTENEPAK